MQRITMDPNDVERMRLKKQQQKARRKEKKAAKDRAETAVHISEALRRVRMLWPGLTSGTLKQFRTLNQAFGPLNELTYEDWEQLGRDLSNCKKIETIQFHNDVVRDEMNFDQVISYLFRGWTRKSSIKEMMFAHNQLSTAGIQNMVPFLQRANNLQSLFICENNIQSEGFNLLFRSLSDSPIKILSLVRCDIPSTIEIDSDHAPRNLTDLSLEGNNINADGCWGLAKLLQGGESTLKNLDLAYNEVDDDGVEILVGALKNNSSLKKLDLRGNDDISSHGQTMLLELVNDISSIEATLQSNQTLAGLYIDDNIEEIQQYINFACQCNSKRQKVIGTQLRSTRRSDLYRLQGIERSNDAFYGEFDPLHLPEVLALVGQAHGLSELHIALKSSMAALLSTVDRTGCLEQELAYHQSRVVDIQAEIASIKRVEGHRDYKRQRI
jgi:hypothetical protein